jgi:DNA-binding MarR family transcriptional regulator
LPVEEPALVFLGELWSLNHALEQASKRMLATKGVTAQQRMVLRFLGKYPGITHGVLAQMLHVDGGTLSFMVKRLEERGLMVRHRDAGDRRRLMLHLSATGRQLDRPASGTVEAAVDRAVRATKRADLAATRRFLQRLVRLLDET